MCGGREGVRDIPSLHAVENTDPDLCSVFLARFLVLTRSARFKSVSDNIVGGNEDSDELRGWKGNCAQLRRLLDSLQRTQPLQRDCLEFERNPALLISSSTSFPPLDFGLFFLGFRFSVPFPFVSIRTDSYSFVSIHAHSYPEKSLATHCVSIES